MLWKQDNFKGGQSYNKYEGIENSFAYLQGINIHDNSRAVTVNQALTKISGSTVTDKVIKFVEVGSNVFGFGNSGCIYKISGSTVTKVYTDTNGAIQDAAYFYGKLYWTTSTKLSRCDATSSDFDTDTDHNWQTLETSNYHLLYPIGNRLFIANGRYVATVSNTEAFVSNSLDIESDWTVRCLSLIKPLLLIGSSGDGRSKCLTWDFINAADSFEEIPGLESGEITQFLEISGAVAAIIGSKLYWYNGILDDPLYDFNQDIEQGAITIYDNMIHLATPKGVYSFGKKNRNYSTVPNLEYITSQGVDVTAIGAIHGTSSNLYVAWENESSYGIDYIDSTAKQSQGIIETLAISEGYTLSPKRVSIYFDPLPADTSIQVKYKTDKDTSWQVIKDASGTTTLTASTEDSTKDSFPLGLNCKTFQLQVLLNSDSNNAPTLRSIETDIDVVK